MLREESFQLWFWICYQSFVLVGIDDNKKMTISRINDNKNVEDHYQSFSPSTITSPTKTLTSDPPTHPLRYVEVWSLPLTEMGYMMRLGIREKKPTFLVRNDLVRCLFIISSMFFEEKSEITKMYIWDTTVDGCNSAADWFDPQTMVCLLDIVNAWSMENPSYHNFTRAMNKRAAGCLGYFSGMKSYPAIVGIIA